MPLHIKGMNKDLAYEASIEILKRVALEKRLDFNINDIVPVLITKSKGITLYGEIIKKVKVA